MGAINMEDVVKDAPEVLPSAPLELVRGYEDEEDAQVIEGGPWRISGEVELDWALKRAAALEEEIALNDETAAARIVEVERRCAKLNERAVRGLRFFRSHIEGYARDHRDAILGGGKRKSRAFINGTIAWRARQPSIEVVDKAALLGWAQGQPVQLGLVRFKEEPAIDAVKKHFKETGEVPPGTELRPGGEDLVVTATGTKGAL